MVLFRTEVNLREDISMINKPVVLVSDYIGFQFGKIRISYLDAYYFRKKAGVRQEPIAVRVYLHTGMTSCCNIEIGALHANFSRDLFVLKDHCRDNSILKAEWFAANTILRIDWPAAKLRKTILERWWKKLSEMHPYNEQLRQARQKMNELLPGMVVRAEKSKKRVLTGMEMQRLSAQAYAHTHDKIWEDIRALPLPHRIDFLSPMPDIKELKKKAA